MRKGIFSRERGIFRMKQIFLLFHGRRAHRACAHQFFLLSAHYFQKKINMGNLPTDLLLFLYLLANSLGHRTILKNKIWTKTKIWMGHYL